MPVCNGDLRQWICLRLREIPLAKFCKIVLIKRVSCVLLIACGLKQAVLVVVVGMMCVFAMFGEFETHVHLRVGRENIL